MSQNRPSQQKKNFFQHLFSLLKGSLKSKDSGLPEGLSPDEGNDLLVIKIIICELKFHIEKLITDQGDEQRFD